MKSKVSIIYVNWNTMLYINRSIEAIERNRPKLSYEYIVIDNGSEDFFELVCPEDKLRKFRFEKNMGYGIAANIGILVSEGKYVCLLNPDTIPWEGWLDKMIDYLELNPFVGLVGPSVSFGYNDFQNPDYNLRNNVESDVVIPFACVVIPKLIIQKIGLLSLLYGEDVDYFNRIRDAGYKAIVVGQAFVEHTLNSSWFANNIGEDHQTQIDYFRSVVAPRFLREEEQ
jgi:GT2 family glycosyltransferase